MRKKRGSVGCPQRGRTRLVVVHEVEVDIRPHLREHVLPGGHLRDGHADRAAGKERLRGLSRWRESNTPSHICVAVQRRPSLYQLARLRSLSLAP